jgi:hypothetical protein
LIINGRPDGRAGQLYGSQNTDLPRESFAQVTASIRIPWIT